MKDYHGGQSGDYAEIIVDYKKKDVSIIDPKKNKAFPESKCGICFNLVVFLIFFGIAGLLIIFKVEYKLWILIGLFCVHYLLGIFWRDYKVKLTKLDQTIQADKFSTRRLVRINKINGKVWILPYNFYNNKLEYKLYGDFGKFINRVHIKPKDYYIKNLSGIHKQTKEWECIFYFSRHPKRGRMEIEWI